MDQDRVVTVSKYLSRHLRHDPGRIGVVLDHQGWAVISELLTCAARHRFPVSRDELFEVVSRNDKARYEVDSSGTLIRARQGHSVPVDLGLEPVPPPATLFHGTASPFVAAIRAEGLRPMGRQHVHLSPDWATAETVGSRHGRPVVLLVAAGLLYAEGEPFWQAGNGVWLVRRVPPTHLRLAP